MNRDEYNIEKAITFLVTSINSSGHNPKPVILHSIRTAMYLYRNNYEEKIIIIALLHDLLEDTNVTYEEIEKQFGNEIASFVKALSFNIDIKDKEERWKDEIDRAITKDKISIIVKTADIFDNMDYYPKSSNINDLPYPLNKAQSFINKAGYIMQNEPIWQQLIDKFKTLTNVII